MIFGALQLDECSHPGLKWGKKRSLGQSEQAAHASAMPYWLPLRGKQGWYMLQMSKGGSLEEQSVCTGVSDGEEQQYALS